MNIEMERSVPSIVDVSQDGEHNSNESVMANPSLVLNYNDNNRCNDVLKHCYMLSIVGMLIVLIEVVSVINVLFNIRKNVKAKIVNVMFVNKWSFSVGIMLKHVWNRIVKYHSVQI